MTIKTNGIRLVTTLLALLCVSSNMFAQQRITVSGVILDGQTGEAVVGASVMAGTTGNGVIADVKGGFTIKVEPKTQLTFSCIGYDDFVMSTDADKKNLVVKLKPSVAQIDEIVVVGYGIQTKASSVAAIEQVKGETLQEAGYLNTVSEALQGQMPGLTAIQSSGQPGASEASLYIRGKASWNGSDPLVLVDGMERNMNFVDMNEIATISVLKDAAAAAVYGVKGANGVILITTKVGSTDKPRISYSATMSAKQFTTDVQFADYVTSMNMWNEAAMNDKNYNNLYPQSTINAWKNAYATGNYGPYNDYFPEVDWYKELVKDFGFSQQHNVNLNGKNKFMSYFASLGYQNDGDMYNIQKQEDFDPRNKYERFNWRANFDFNITPTTTFSAKISGRRGYKSSSLTFDNMFGNILNSASNEFPIKYSDGVWGDSKEQGHNFIANTIYKGEDTSKAYQGWYDFQLNQKLDFITKGLSLYGKLSYNTHSTYGSWIQSGRQFGKTRQQAQLTNPRYFRSWDYANPHYDADGNVYYDMLTEIRYPDDNATDADLPVGVGYDSLDAYGRKLYYEAAIQYNRTFGKHNVTALGLWNRTMTENLSGSNLSFPSYTEDWVGRVTYNYDKKYLFEANGSYTGSEKFAPGKRFGFFPSASIGWRISEEDFIKNTSLADVITNLKIRYSYGQVGTDQGATAFSYIQTYNQEAGISLGYTTRSNTSYKFAEGTAANANASWEVATKQNLGIEIDLWSKLSVEIDLFDEKRDGILMTSRGNMAWYGAEGYPAINIGQTKNHGLEITASWNEKIGRLRYGINWGLCLSENRIVYKQDPPGMDDYDRDAGKPIGYSERFIALGNYSSIDDLFNATQTKLAQTNQSNLVTGDLIYADFNGDGQITDLDQVVTAQINYPLKTSSLNLQIGYGNWSASVMLYGAWDYYKGVWDVLTWDFPSSRTKAQINTLERWTASTASDTGVQRPSVHLSNNYNQKSSTYTYVDYSYLRIKNAQIQYNIPKRYLNWFDISSVSLFLRGNNLYTLCDVTRKYHIDPETSSQSTYPLVKTYTFGLNVVF